MFLRDVSFAALTLTSALCAGTAHAANVQWSVGINLPPIATVVSSGPAYVYEPAPVYLAPAPTVIYRPVPVYVPRPRYVVPVVYGRPRWGHDHHGEWHDHRNEWHDDHRGDDHRRDDHQGDGRFDGPQGPDPRRHHW